MAVLAALRRPVPTIGFYIVFAPHAASVLDVPAVLSGACVSLYIRVLPAQNYQVSTHDDDAFTSREGRVQLVQMFILFTYGKAER